MKKKLLTQEEADGIFRYAENGKVVRDKIIVGVYSNVCIGTSFVNCEFKDSDFDGTTFINCDFSLCEFNKVSFYKAEFHGCNFLSGFKNCIFREAIFIYAKFKGPTVMEECCLQRIYFWNSFHDALSIFDQIGIGGDYVVIQPSEDSPIYFYLNRTDEDFFGSEEEIRKHAKEIDDERLLKTIDETVEKFRRPKIYER